MPCIIHQRTVDAPADIPEYPEVAQQREAPLFYYTRLDDQCFALCEQSVINRVTCYRLQARGNHLIWDRNPIFYEVTPDTSHLVMTLLDDFPTTLMRHLL